jgi:hypoxanthine phosphoribosyltransferase
MQAPGHAAMETRVQRAGKESRPLQSRGMHADIDQILFTREVIEDRVKEMAAQVMGVWRERPLTVVVVLKGAFVFAADLVRHIAQPCDMVFVRAASYGGGTASNGRPALELPSDVEWKGRHVLVVEDIVDTGHTVKQLVAAIEEKGAASVRVCAFLDKPARRVVPVEVHFVGFALEGEPFVVGYGLDFAGRYRNLPFIGTLKSGAQRS